MKKKLATKPQETTYLMEQLADGRWCIGGEATFDTQDEARNYMIARLNEAARELKSPFKIVQLPDGRFYTAPLRADGTPNLEGVK
jgi:hypothetical protein